MKRIFRSVILFIIFTTITFAANASGNIKPVKYVFLFIGDGMSIPQRMLADSYSVKTTQNKLFINSMPVQALTTTSSGNSFVTDSAASGTAIACGEKTANGCLGLALDKKRRLESIAEVAKKSGRKVGIITTVTINHATPGAFYAHVPSRTHYYNIALDMLKSDFDYFAGGGIEKANDTENAAYCGDIHEIAPKYGYKVVRSPDAVRQLQPGSGKVIAAMPIPYAIDRKKGDIALKELVQKAITLLDNPKGFFIMAEGGKIDYSGHANDGGTNIHEVVDFDNAVKAAYDFARKHPSETLIVVTGDHETGGLTLGFTPESYQNCVVRLAAQKCSSAALHGKFKKLKNPTFDDVKKIISENFNLAFPGDKNVPENSFMLTEDEVKKIQKSFDKQFADGKFDRKGVLAIEVQKILNSKAALSWSTTGHTSMPLMTTVYGSQQEMFGNFIDNTDIAKLLKQAVR